MKDSGQTTMAQLASSAWRKLWEDSVDHGADAASVFSSEAADVLAGVSVLVSLGTLGVSAFYAGWALVQFLKARRDRKNTEVSP
ncbi:MAG: hypothetical protein AB7Q01_07310 [Gammaproteobacteria bacterium]